MPHAGWTSRGYLPHCDGAGLVQHIVFATIGVGDEIAENFGAHFLRGAAAAGAVQNALLRFDGQRYRLIAWCVMPNHVHVILEQIDGWTLAKIVHSLKSYSANQINRIVGRSGAVWLREYFDRFMRTDVQLSTTIAYVENNPVVAGFVTRAEEWLFSSARTRKQ